MHLYLHVPFCARRCSYCDFAIAVRRQVPAERYVQSVLLEWRRWQEDPALRGVTALETVYLGGGTPSLLPPGALARLLEAIGQARPLAGGAEVTLEANPEDVTAAKARAWRRAGITRVSLGVQSFDPRALAWMHRVHSAEQIPHAVGALREAGFANLTLDLIYGLPPELERDWSHDLEQALALEPQHLSVYGLTVEAHTPLARWIARGEARPAQEERQATEFLLAHQRLRSAGFEHYEVSNFARPGFRAVHNSAYWRRLPYIGLGPSAHSGFADLRQWNLREWTAYEQALQRGASPVAGRETLDAPARRLEQLYLGLRTSEGVPQALVAEPTRRQWVAADWAVLRDERLTLTPEGWLRLDALVREC